MSLDDEGLWWTAVGLGNSLSYVAVREKKGDDQEKGKDIH